MFGAKHVLWDGAEQPAKQKFPSRTVTRRSPRRSCHETSWMVNC